MTASASRAAWEICLFVGGIEYVVGGARVSRNRCAVLEFVVEPLGERPRVAESRRGPRFGPLSVQVELGEFDG